MLIKEECHDFLDTFVHGCEYPLVIFPPSELKSFVPAGV